VRAAPEGGTWLTIDEPKVHRDDGAPITVARVCASTRY
jgi:hypothetical protein